MNTRIVAGYRLLPDAGGLRCRFSIISSIFTLSYCFIWFLINLFALDTHIDTRFIFSTPCLWHETERTHGAIVAHNCPGINQYSYPMRLKVSACSRSIRASSRNISRVPPL